jgi:endonuclease/exonuclease/phosphatase family metal-dependent hydrolase
MLRFAVLLSLPFLGCIPNETLITPPLVTACTGPVPSALRAATYNIKSGSQTSLQEVGDVLAGIAPDIVALEELNYDPKQSNADADQPRVLSDRLGQHYVFAAALSRGGSHLYGIALSSRFPFKSVSRIDLRALGAAEPRVAIDATLCVGSKEVRVIATHADVWQPMPGIATVASHLDAQVSSPTLVLGDLNVKATDTAASELLTSHGLTDLIAKYAEGPTFWSDNKRIDYIFADAWLTAHSTGAAIGNIKASDHFPVWADFAL